MYTYAADVLRVVDGDTVDLRIDLGFSVAIKRRVRLLGIDTPEVRTRDAQEKMAGFAARDRLIELLDAGDVVVKTAMDKSGKYGRVLGTLYVGESDVSVNDTLLSEGYAKPYAS